MAPQQKQFWKAAGVIVAAGIFIVGVIFGAGKIVEQKTQDHDTIILQQSTLNNHEIRLQEVEKVQAVQNADQRNMKETLDDIKQTTNETNKLLRDLLKERRK